MSCNKKFIITIQTILVSWVLLLIVQFSTIKIQTKDQLLRTQKILHHSEYVATQLSDAINKVVAATINKCNDSGLNKLRDILWNYHDIIDLGIIENGRVVCTAVWGQVENSKGYIKNDYTSANGYSFHSNVKDIFPTKISADATIYRNVVVFTSPYAFNQLNSIFSELSFIVTSKSKKYTFLENTKKYVDNNKYGFLYAKVNIVLCSNLHRLCVNSLSNNAGVFALPLKSILLIVFLCILVGYLISKAINIYLFYIRSFEYRLKKAIHSKSLYLEYQPIVRVADGKIVGVEMLVRWRDKYYGQVSPELFVSVAERIHLYADISKIVINTFSKELADILIKNDEFVASINIGSQEIQDQDYLNILYETVVQNGIKPSQIKIEITERSVDSYNKIAEFSQNAKSKGFIVSLDDFGTGSANMTWLAEVDFDEIKIDKFYVQGMNEEYKKRILISILELVKSLNPQLVFEGVENKQQLDFIKANFPSSYVQGWFYYKSMSKNDLLKALRSH